MTVLGLKLFFENFQPKTFNLQPIQQQLVTENDIIEGCKCADRKAQKALFDTYSPKMFGVCLRYVKNRQDAEDVMIEGLFKAITKISSFSGNGSFEGWIRRIVVNESLMHLRKKNVLKHSVEIPVSYTHLTLPTICSV